MKTLNLITLFLVIVGGLNWGLVGAFQFDLVATIFAENPMIANIVYSLVGLSALYQILPLMKACDKGEIAAERAAV